MLPPVLGTLSALLGLWMGWGFISSSAATFDEPAHLARGVCYWKTGALLKNLDDHPPAAEMAAALPPALRPINFPPREAFDLPARQPAVSERFLYGNTAAADPLLNSARSFAFILWMAILAVATFLFVTRLEDRASGWLSLVFLFFNPVLLSNSALVTTDAGAAAFFMAAFLPAMLFSRDCGGGIKNRGGALKLALAGLFTALAMASKYSMALLPLFVAITLAADLLRGERRGAAVKTLKAVSVYAAATLIFLLLIYRVTDINLYFNGLFETSKRVTGSKTSFINGLHLMDGVWWYFPYAFLVKNPLPTLLLAAVGLFYSFRKGKRSHLWIYAPAFLYLAFAMRSTFQIGVRHVLPLLPLLAAAAGIGARRLLENRRLRPAAWVLIALLAVSVLRVHPHYLAYFNEAAGGAERGYLRLLDSNLDWGQGLKPLGQYLAKIGAPPVYLSYFGTARPEYYGIRYVPLGGFGRPQTPTGENPCLFTRHILAVSATNLQNVYYADRRFFDWLRDRKPDQVVGYSVFVYDITEDRAAMLKLAESLYRLGLPEQGRCLRKKII